MTIEQEIRALAAKAVAGAAPCIQERRRSTAPRDTGELAGSIDAAVRSARGGNTFRVRVAQDDRKAPHGPIINNPKGGRIEAKPGGALGPFQHAGQTMFRRSVRQSTVHKGWWEDWDWIGEFESCLKAQL